MALRGRNNSANQEEENKAVEINAQMQGSLIFKDSVSLKINGVFNGSLETKGTLTIGNRAEIIATIDGENIIIAGKVNGDIRAQKMLTLMPTAVLKGNITTPKLNIVEGALFQGKCQMMSDIVGDLLDIDEVAKYLEIDLTEIEELANSGKIPGTRSGDSWKFERSKIDNWAASGRIK
jgi:excisionase family DNA binding protein